MAMLQLYRPAHQLFSICGQLVVLYDDGSLGTTECLLYEADCSASSPFIVWSQSHVTDGQICIVVVFRDKVGFAEHPLCLHCSIRWRVEGTVIQGCVFFPVGFWQVIQKQKKTF